MSFQCPKNKQGLESPAIKGDRDLMYCLKDSTTYFEAFVLLFAYQY